VPLTQPEDRARAYATRRIPRISALWQTGKEILFSSLPAMNHNVSIVRVHDKLQSVFKPATVAFSALMSLSLSTSIRARVCVLRLHGHQISYSRAMMDSYDGNGGAMSDVSVTS
jgi:hypothetical protein